MHQLIRPLSLAAAVVTVGALALPVSAAFAESGDQPESSTEVGTTTPSDDATTDAAGTAGSGSVAQQESEDHEGSEAPEVEKPEVEADQGNDAETDDDHGDHAQAPVTGTAGAAPVVAPTKPWHVKTRLADRDSAVVVWRDRDTTGVTFTVTLVPVGSATAAALPTVSGTATTRSARFDDLVAGTRYRATVTATADGGTAVSATSNTVVTPKAKAAKAAKRAKPTKHAEAGEHAKAGKQSKTGEHAKASKQAKAGKQAKHAHHVAKRTTEHRPERGR